MRYHRQTRRLACMLLMGLCLPLPAAADSRGAHAHFDDPQAQERFVAEVKLAVHRLREAGLPGKLDVVPQVEDWTAVLVSDAISVVEVAHVHVPSRQFYLSIRNPWTNCIDWYGIFDLDEVAHGADGRE